MSTITLENCTLEQATAIKNKLEELAGRSLDMSPLEAVRMAFDGLAAAEKKLADRSLANDIVSDPNNPEFVIPRFCRNCFGFSLPIAAGTCAECGCTLETD